ncbi:MAG: hypothetical protein ACE5EM_09150 [Sphingomonadales bacterium]
MREEVVAAASDRVAAGLVNKNVNAQQQLARRFKDGDKNTTKNKDLTIALIK